MGATIERAFIFTRGQSIELDALPENVRSPVRDRRDDPAPVAELAAAGELAGAEAEAIRQALDHHDGNRSRASRDLGIHRSTLLRKMRKLGME